MITLCWEIALMVAAFPPTEPWPVCFRASEEAAKAGRLPMSVIKSKQSVSPATDFERRRGLMVFPFSNILFSKRQHIRSDQGQGKWRRSPGAVLSSGADVFTNAVQLLLRVFS